MTQLITGKNDLKTKFPEIAKEAYGWNPSTLMAGSSKKKSWICKFGHVYISPVSRRTGSGSGCTFCAGKKVLAGFNDINTKHPQIAQEADGWDPSTEIAYSHKKKNWICKLGHKWEASIKNRTLHKRGCPYCSNHKVLFGFNDLQTKYPEIAKEAHEWDPKLELSQSNKKKNWICKSNHIYQAQISNRTAKNTGCPYCSNHKVLFGFNDLQTKYPEIAKEAHEWDPKEVVCRSNKRKNWKCHLGHIWQATVDSRTSGNNCPFCGNQKLLIGFNDLKTKYPEIAKEAYGWDPERVISGSHSKKLWICHKGHTWKTSLHKRCGTEKTGCPACAESGFNPEKPAWFYLLERENEQQFGITNVLKQRLKFHKKFGWEKVDIVGPEDGKKVLEAEKILKKWLKENIGLVPGKHENWYKANMKVSSLAELKKISRIKTSIFTEKK